MLHVIGLILKLIGILLLAVLCLLLLLLLIVLLVPIRYRVEAEHGEELLAVEGRVNWLLHLINARVTYLEGVFHVQVRILWFILFDNLKPKKPKEPKEPKEKKVKEVRKRQQTREIKNHLYQIRWKQILWLKIQSNRGAFHISIKYLRQQSKSLKQY
jgi:hypothetical protein